MVSHAQINMKYIIFITILLIILMLAVLLTHTEFSSSMDKVYSGLDSTVGGISDTAEDLR